MKGQCFRIKTQLPPWPWPVYLVISLAAVCLVFIHNRRADYTEETCEPFCHGVKVLLEICVICLFGMGQWQPDLGIDPGTSRVTGLAGAHQRVFRNPRSATDVTAV